MTTMRPADPDEHVFLIHGAMHGRYGSASYRLRRHRSCRIAPDLPDMERTGTPRAAVTLANYVRAWVAVGLGGEPVVLVGHSMGRHGG